jgi:hypothetical protein
MFIPAGLDEKASKIWLEITQYQGEGLHVYPGISHKKLANARESHKVPTDETIIAIVDASVFDTAKRGLLFGKRGIYYKNDWASNSPGTWFISYEEFPNIEFQQASSHDIFLGFGRYFNTSPSDVPTKDIVDMLKQVRNIIMENLHIYIAQLPPVLKGQSLPELVKHHFGKKRSWAVVIGIDKYNREKGFEPLPYAVADAIAVRDHLVEYLDFSLERIIELYNEDATKTRIDEVLGDKLPKKLSENDRLLVFYSGHGVTTDIREGKKFGYLIPFDGDRDKLYTTALSMRNIGEYADLIRARQILFVIDACYSGIIGTTYRKGKLLEETRQQVEKFIKSSGRQIMTAGAADESVVMSDKWDGHSVYTYYFLRGLQGEADTNNDEVISARELQVFLDNTVPKEARQTPQLFDLVWSEGQFVFYREGDF